MTYDVFVLRRTVGEETTSLVLSENRQRIIDLDIEVIHYSSQHHQLSPFLNRYQDVQMASKTIFLVSMVLPAWFLILYPPDESTLILLSMVIESP